MDTGVTLVRRLSDQPVVAYGSVPGYGAIFNAGLLVRDGVYHLFARGVREGYYRNPGEGDRFLNYISDVLVLTSLDGLHYDYRYVLAHAGDAGVHCYEDARVHAVHEGGVEHVVMTYTNLPDRASDEVHHIGAHRLLWRDGRFHLDGMTRCLGPTNIANKDGVVFNLEGDRVAFVQRMQPNMQIAVFENLSALWNADEDYWATYLSELESHVLIAKRDGLKGLGAGSPPVAVDGGLLTFFHETFSDGVYVACVALLDAVSGRVLRRLDEPVLVPELAWELHGDVDNVVFVQGAHVFGDYVYLVYGAADDHVGAGIAHIPDLLAAMVDQPE